MESTGSHSHTGGPTRADPPAQRARDVLVPVPLAGPVSPSPTVAAAVEQAVRAVFGLAAVAAEVTLRALVEPAGQPSPGPARAAAEAVDLGLAAAWGLARLSGRVALGTSRVVAPVLQLAANPPLVPGALRPATRLQALTARWDRDRPTTVGALGRFVAVAVPVSVDAALARVDVPRVTDEVLRRVDLDRVVEEVLAAVDLDRAVTTALASLDLDSVVETVLAGIDVDVAATTALRALDLDALAGSVVGALDVDTLVDAVLDRLDLTALVIERVDLGKVVDSALDELDLTRIVTERVDLGAVVEDALDQLDLTQLVLQRVDLVGVAEYVVDEIDLPEIIRDSTGSVASETVRTVRMQGVDADRTVARIVDRIMLRRRQRRTDAPGAPLSEAATDAPEQQTRPDPAPPPDRPTGGEP